MHRPYVPLLAAGAFALACAAGMCCGGLLQRRGRDRSRRTQTVPGVTRTEPAGALRQTAPPPPYEQAADWARKAMFASG